MSTCRFAPVSTESLMFQFLNRSRGLASSVPASATTTIVVVFAIVAALYFGREVLVPMALALVLSFVLAPIVRRLQSWRVPRVWLQFPSWRFLRLPRSSGLARSWCRKFPSLRMISPRYQSTLREKIQSLQGVATGAGPLERASDVLKDLKKQIDRPSAEAPAELSLGNQAQPSRPIPAGGQAARSRSAPGARNSYRAPHTSPDDNRHRRHFRDLYAISAERSQKPSCSACWRQRSSPHDGSS